MTAKKFVPAAFIGSALLVWELLVRLLKVPPYLLPAPSAIFASVNTRLMVDLSVTMAEALAGFAIAGLCAFVAALVFVRWPLLEDGLFPVAITLKTTPLVAIAPLLVLWMGTGMWSKITAAA
ncbi:MAG TPA: ABC transporter permease, partial [bacterium]|nr:ABC transporter permease [bacterium]